LPLVCAFAASGSATASIAIIIKVAINFFIALILLCEFEGCFPLSALGIRQRVCQENNTALFQRLTRNGHYSDDFFKHYFDYDWTIWDVFATEREWRNAARF
jgi:hypothetical protein